jgi:hypothetical protein
MQAIMRAAGMLLGFGLIVVAALLGGCRRGAAPLTPVSGKVAFQTRNLTGGLIVFTPDNSKGNSGQMAVGKIAQDGSYYLYTGDTAGASAGWYRITVTSFGPTGVQVAGQMPNPPNSYLPEKYRDPVLSELSCEIKPDKPNAINFNLD